MRNKKLLFAGILLFSSIAISAATTYWSDVIIWGNLYLSSLTANTVPYLNGSSALTASSTTPTELGYVHNVTSSLCGINQTCTLTNKTIAAGSNTISGLTNSSLSGAAAITNANLASVSNNTIKSNISGSGGVPSDNSVTSVLDSAFSSTQGAVLYRGASSWSALSPGSNGNILTSGGTFANPSWQAPAGATPVWNYVTKNSNYTATVNDYISASGATTTITLPTAVGNSGKTIAIQDTGTNLIAIPLLTTSAQTIGGVASGSYALYTVGERLFVISDGSNWQILNHDTNTGWISDTTATMQYITFTVTSASATIAATYAPAYVFTVTSANATVGATYTNNGHTYTVAATIAAQTTLVVTGPADPLTSGTLTKATGTGDATITFSAFTGNADIAATTYTIAQTIASQTTLIAAGKPTSVNPNSSGRLVKISGTGDAIITYSSFTGTAVQSIDATATTPVFYGSPTSNSVKWMRFGDKIKINFLFSQTTAGASAGSGDYIFLLPNGIQFNTSIYPAYTTTGAQLTTVAAAAPSMLPTTGKVMLVGGSSYSFYIDAFVYSSNQYRMELLWTGPTGSQVGTSAFAATSLIIYNWTIEAPISGWQP